MENRRFVRRPALLTLISTFALILGGCGSMGLGGILGGGGGGGTASSNSGEISGVVDRVDTRDQAIILQVSNSNLRSSGGDLVAIYYDGETVVAHEGQGYPATALEPGDRITAMVVDVGGRPTARQVRVDYDSSPYDDTAGTSGDNDWGTSGTSQTEMVGRGTVSWVDTRSRTVEVENVQWSGRSGTTARIVLDFDDRTRLEMNGRVYALDSLQRGDYVEFISNNAQRPYVRDMKVLRNATGSTSGSASTWGADIRGTVSYLDTRNRFVELERGNERWSSNFVPGTAGTSGTSADKVRVYYSDTTVVEYQGQSYRPDGLERGDVVDVWTETVNGRLYTERMMVVQDVNQRR